ncbi:hypothetical protein [Haliangium sp.]|uniref:hypothetical protein n=1 Tax=Haliangium sp. TaxID=2663208 RepID=UPI003D0FF357
MAVRADAGAVECGRGVVRLRGFGAAIVLALVLAIPSWPMSARANDWIDNFFIPTRSTLRSWQRILTVEGTGGLYLLPGDDAGEVMRGRDLGALVLVPGARVRLTMGYNEALAWTLSAVGGRSTFVRTDEMESGAGAREHRIGFGGVSVGGVLRYGDMRTVYVHADIGAQWTAHATRTSANSKPELTHELSAVSTVGFGFDQRLGNNALIGVNVGSSWIALSTLRSRGLQSLHAGLRVGVAWL